MAASHRPLGNDAFSLPRGVVPGNFEDRDLHAALTGISRASDKKRGQLEGLLGVRQSERLVGFRVKAEKPEKVLPRQFVEHEYLTRGALAKLLRTAGETRGA
jgi:hypothetical protein